MPDVRHVSNVSNTPENFTAGKIRFFYSNWTRLTGDSDILQYVRGCCIDFSSEPHKPLQTRSVHYPADRCVILDAEVEKLYNKKVIEKVDNCSEGFFSTIFTRPKKDGSYRLILNLKNLNQCVDTWHFKMETVKTAMSLITPNCWFASIDLKDAYYSVSIADSDRKYLKFVWKHSVYQFTCLPNGLASAPRIFTKLLKPLFSTLRKKGHTNLAYLDDSLLVSDSNIDCTHNVSDTVALVDSLGLTLHPDKSVLVPTQEITFLGFVLNSLTMTVSLPSEKKVNIVQMCASLKRKQIVVIRDLAILVGKLVAAEPAVEYAPLYIKTLERDKDRGLRANKGNFEERIRLSRVSLCDLQWWIDNLHTACKWLRRQPPDIVISTDSSKSGWGGIMHDSNLHTGGHWSYVEKNDHINVLELKAAFLVLQSLCASRSNVHVRLQLDNTVAVSYIHRMGGRIEELHTLAKTLWSWCIVRNIWLSAAHIPGSSNVEADSLSRKLSDDMEWALVPRIFDIIHQMWPLLRVDLFASRLNHKLANYVSFLPDPQAFGVDAFTLKWCECDMYSFPPFSILHRVLHKVEEDQVEQMILVAPIWPTQVWFPVLLRLLCGPSYILPVVRQSLHHPTQRDKHHPLSTMRLGVFPVSGQHSKGKVFRQTLPPSSQHLGDTGHRNNMGVISRGGCNFASKGKLIHIDHLNM